MSRQWWVGVLWAVCMGGSAAQEQVPACPDDLSPAQVLEQLNAVRAQARSCGAGGLSAAPLLCWDARLALSAQRYAQELAQRDAISHTGERSRSLRERLAASGYLMRSSGENLAAGQLTLDEALQHWLASPAHCENLMAANFEDAGLACVAAPGRYQRFWVLHMGSRPGGTQGK